MIERVTITGADNSVNPKELLGLTLLYPFEEWGILLPFSQYEGIRRFPNKQWLTYLLQLRQESSDTENIRLSAHICPPYSMDIIQYGNMDEIFKELDLDISHFGRIQLNVHGLPVPSYCSAFIDWCKTVPQEVILQADGINDWITRGVPNISVLYDTSSGAGEFSNEWANHSQAEKPFGYAGGLNLDTLPIALIEWLKEDTSKSFWIDLETGVRQGGLFDTSKAQAVLDYTRPFIN